MPELLYGECQSGPPPPCGAEGADLWSYALLCSALLSLARVPPFRVSVAEWAGGDQPWGGSRYSAGAPTGFPSGETAYQVPPTPWPLVCPAAVSPEKV